LWFIKHWFSSSTFVVKIATNVDEGKLVVLANGFQKKSQKTPKLEIEKALKIKEEYENEK
jgi:phage-related protein